MADENCEYCVMEVSSRALAQERVAGCNFVTGVFTNLTQDHLDYHHTFEAYRDAKKKLFSMSELAIVNMDDSYHKDMIEGIKSRAVSFSIENDAADYTAKNIQYRQSFVEYELVTKGDSGRVHRYPRQVLGLQLNGCYIRNGFSLKDVLDAWKGRGRKGTG